MACQLLFSPAEAAAADAIAIADAADDYFAL